MRSAHDDLPETINQLAAMAKEMHFDTATLISKLKLMVSPSRSLVTHLSHARFSVDLPLLLRCPLAECMEQEGES